MNHEKRSNLAKESWKKRHNEMEQKEKEDEFLLEQDRLNEQGSIDEFIKGEYID